MTRHADRAEALRALGAEAVVSDALDPEAIARAIVRAKPHTVIHELTRIPAKLSARHLAAELSQTNRLRTEGTRNLLVGALEAGVGRVISQGIAFAYRPVGGWVKVEEDPLYTWYSQRAVLFPPHRRPG